MQSNPNLLAICASLKPARGRTEPSACREILRAATIYLSRVVPNIESLDLRDATLPGFEGLAPAHHYDPAVMQVHQRIRAASGLIFSIPAYWGGVGGAFKTFVELVCGPSYENASSSPFQGKPAVALLVGSDALSTQSAISQLDSIFEAIGAHLTSELVVVPNPAATGAADAATRALIGASAQLAQHIIKVKEGA
ncbi:NAD(P)H-dependent oxidoreductase [Rhizobium leguminosarum]|uniref:NAD(P)H-dependent oxidoreductase n=1 Tax=Rhizobium leguminosarum TaxID=384 RepID=UPI001C97012B|nr:NAD(P)H-dependent oxidoreductase [Rhizobium leguminosarum]MBY5728489.1 NAD(P)H-dependent oxidoreductase [Rhizobium leguminosarum]